ncbi:MAG: TDT family transporter [Aerococcus sp.]|nr:TDT family transporter [Aerococcus sp.]
MIKKVLNALPLPVSGVALGLLSLGNLLQTHGALWRPLCGVIGGILLALLTLKIATNFAWLKEQLKQPVLASVFPTYCMALMLLATYVKPIIGDSARFLWYAGLILHLSLIIWFSYRCLRPFQIKQVFASWAVVYVGAVVASVTAPAFQFTAIGRVIWVIGAVLGVLVLPVIFYRVIKVRAIPFAAKPTTTILCAPLSLLLAGYLSSFPSPKWQLVVPLLVVAQTLYIVILTQLPKLSSGGFRASYAAFTFPFVISAMSLKLAVSAFSWQGFAVIVAVESAIATVAVFTILIEYLNFIVRTALVTEQATLTSEVMDAPILDEE